MGNCIYCKQPAGFLRKKHSECHKTFKQRLKKADEGKKLILNQINKALKESLDFQTLDKIINELEVSYFVPSSERTKLLSKAWEDTVDYFLDDGILDTSEEERLSDFKSYYALTQDDLDQKGALTKTVKAVILRDVLNGVVPESLPTYVGMPINLQKGERVIWAFTNSDYLEDKVRRQFVGGSQGVSVRVAKGVYYRAGSFKGHSVERTERVHVDTGLVVLTTKHIYFAGSNKSLRLPYSKIVSFEPFSDGIGIIRDASNAKPQIFVTGDGWFTYNLVSNLSQI